MAVPLGILARPQLHRVADRSSDLFSCVAPTGPTGEGHEARREGQGGEEGLHFWTGHLRAPWDKSRWLEGFFGPRAHFCVPFQRLREGAVDGGSSRIFLGVEPASGPQRCVLSSQGSFCGTFRTDRTSHQVPLSVCEKCILTCWR